MCFVFEPNIHNFKHFLKSFLLEQPLGKLQQNLISFTLRSFEFSN